ncbi:RNA-directed DNA polymerase [Streptomyces malaysiensis]|uniref:RNA-directed DNA polymerase n=2 Tax=Streptomyces malaysiensis TaxID=92644 RepID=A0A7X5XCA9_STRMQ|nr:RNA-directed DNA polymerase [Streptomyces malaysiensis]
MMLNDDDYTIIGRYQAEYRGIVQYFLLANNIADLGKLRWVMETSMLKTLAGKHHSTVSKMARKYKATIDTPKGPRVCFRVTVRRGEGKKPLTAWFGGIPLQRQPKAKVVDRSPSLIAHRGNELIRRLLAGHCEICEATERLEVHHIRKLADLARPGRKEKPAWVVHMAKRRRKTLVLCIDCHDNVHAGRLTKPTRQ